MYRDKLEATQPKMFTQTFIQEEELIADPHYWTIYVIARILFSHSWLKEESIQVKRT